MADETLGTAIVSDRRTKPEGVFPRHVQTWLMVGIAVVMLVIILMTARTTPPGGPRAAAALEPGAPSPERLRDYQDRLRLLEQRTDAQVPVEPEFSAPLELRPPRESAPQADPMRDEQRRRDAQSLFASNLAWSRSARGVASPSPQNPTPGPQSAAPPPSSTAPAPALQPAPLHRISEGTIIESVLTTRLDGANASPVNCLVTTPVYSRDGQHVLIPAGSRLLGNTRPVQSANESRLAVTFHRLLLPDGSAHPLEQFPGLNQRGDAALHDLVNRHYLETFGAAAAVGLISGLGGLVANAGTGARNSGDSVTVIGDATSAGGQAVSQTVTRFLNRQPTITIREGHRVNVYLTADLDLPAFKATW
jgi:type IV secretion system protein TrbI